MIIKIRRANEKTDLNTILDCLSSLSDVSGDVEKIQKAWWDRFTLPNLICYVAEEEGIEATHNTYGIVAKVVGTASLFFMDKITHGGSKVAYLDDVAVLRGYKGEGVGKILINHLIKEAKLLGCRKMILGCNTNLEQYYSKFGFYKSNIEMRLDYEKMDLK